LTSARRLLSATDVMKVCGISRQALGKMRLKGDGPPSAKVGSVAITPLDTFLDWISRELSRATRPRWLRKLAKE
jgi:predicted DNA-binding transcriptional regulator AlpA